ncbi:MAG: methionyl-tRNA formyltransferase [bacterium]|nr:methionyl-tRNA formyltransferase [bacterium]
MIDKKNLRIVFFGTPDFAVASLKTILENHFNVVGVVTAPDKPAGRGYELQQSAVKKFASEQGLTILQPVNLKSDDFNKALSDLKADLQIVIAFRMLPEKVWSSPRLGTFNLHASYLPNYRGAAPINWAIINGETSTGITTFFLKHEIDTGSILLQESTPILPTDNVGTLHDKLMHQGAQLVVKSLELILTETYALKEQIVGDFKHASKIFTEHCLINWSQSAEQVHNLVRGLSPFPTAFAIVKGKKLKIFETEITDLKAYQVGQVEIIDKALLISCSDKKLKLLSIQPEGKKRMPVADFLNGFRITEPTIAQSVL